MISCTADRAADSPELCANAPVALQVIGRRYEDEALISSAQIVDDALAAFKSNVQPTLHAASVDGVATILSVL